MRREEHLSLFVFQLSGRPELAYATALDLPGGLLVYVQGETADAVHVVRHAGKRLEVAALGLAGTIGDLRRRINGLAERVRRLHDAGLTASRAA